MIHADDVCVAQFIQCFKKEPSKTNQPTEDKTNPKNPNQVLNQ